MLTLRLNPFHRLALTAGACAALLLAGSAHALDLSVEILQARSSQGTVNAALYSDAAHWLGDTQRAQRAPASDRVVLVFHDLPPGRYALSAYHDANGNDKLDRNLVGMPTEAYGFSRDAVGHFGPASFDDAAVDLQADTTLTVHLH